MMVEVEDGLLYREPSCQGPRVIRRLGEPAQHSHRIELDLKRWQG
jgi:hypothetical protein